jgi:tetratricopeptide (TPR) repeat protein
MLLCLAVAISGCANQNNKSEGVETNATKLYVRGALDYQQQNYDHSMQSLDAALRTDPNLIMARFLMGTIYREKANTRRPRSSTSASCSSIPYSYTNHYYLGLMNHLLNRLQEAAASYLTAIKLNPNDVKSNMYLGSFTRRWASLKSACPMRARPPSSIQNPPKPRRILGWCSIPTAIMPPPKRAYRRALELDPNRPETLVNLAGALMSQKRYKDAVTAYEQAVKMQDSSLVRVRYGYALLYSGQIEAATKQFNQSLEQNQRNFQALNGLGDAAAAQYKASSLLDEKKRSDAIGFWKRSLDINPEQPRVAAQINEYSKGGLIP